MNKVTVKIEGQDYLVDVEKATQLGLLEKVKKFRPISIKDIKNGTIFRWEGREFLMINNQLQGTGQCVCITNNAYKGESVWFRQTTHVEFYDFDSRTWINEIEE